MTHLSSWWLNIACAHRDGIVGTAFQEATKGRYGNAALPLLTGMEEDFPDGKTVYIREGKAYEMHPSLISQCGQKIRILRGFRLKSMRQPRAGVRYDGLYIIHNWSIKLNINTDLYTLRLTLERVRGQKSMDEVIKIPKPSQLDDWKIYEQLERGWIRQTEGKAKLKDWTMVRIAEREERSSWRSSRVLGPKIASQDFDAGGGPLSPRRRRLSDIDTRLLPPPEEEEEAD